MIERNEGINHIGEIGVLDNVLSVLGDAAQLMVFEEGVKELGHNSLVVLFVVH